MRWITRDKPKKPGSYFVTVDMHGERKKAVRYFNGLGWNTDDEVVIAWNDAPEYDGKIYYGSKYQLISIVHSGRKGERGEPMTDEKYDGLVGQYIIASFQEVDKFSPFIFWFANKSIGYDYWRTSAVLALSRGITTNGKEVYELETANSIYRFEEVVPDEMKRGE